MGATSNDEKYKNMEIELDHLKNYIQKQNKYYKGLIQKEEQKRKEIERPLQQKIENQRIVIDQLARKAREMEHLIESKDNTITQQSEQRKSESQYSQNVIDNFQKREAELKNKLNDAERKIKIQEDAQKRDKENYEKEISCVEKEKMHFRTQLNIISTELETLKEENHELTIVRQNHLRNSQSETMNRLDRENVNLRTKISQALQEKDAVVNALDVERHKQEQMNKEVQLRVSFLIKKMKNIIEDCNKERNKLPMSQREKNSLEWIEDKLGAYVSEFQGDYILTDCSILSKLQNKVDALELDLKQRNEDVTSIQRSDDRRDDSCIICTEPLIFPECNKCNQFFHKECICKWFNEKKDSECGHCRGIDTIQFPIKF